jgi:hypothetical protein
MYSVSLTQQVFGCCFFDLAVYIAMHKKTAMDKQGQSKYLYKHIPWIPQMASQAEVMLCIRFLNISHASAFWNKKCCI